MPELRERHEPDLTVVNGENSAGGLGITERTARDLFGMGFDVITLGNHTYRRREAYEYLDHAERVIRPANFMAGSPGKGHVIVEAGGMRVCVINLIGMVQMQAARSPFAEADALLDRLASEADAFVFDFHAEVTSEKVAMGWHLDGRAAAVLGTHTHVPTADARVLPQGTAFISDVGMTGLEVQRAGCPLGAGARGFPDPDAAALRDGRRGHLGERGRRGRERARPGGLDRAGSDGRRSRLTSPTLSLPPRFAPKILAWTAAPPRWVRGTRRPGPPVSTTLPTSTMGAASPASPVLTASRFTRSSSGRSRPWTIWSTAARRAPIPRPATAPGS